MPKYLCRSRPLQDPQTLCDIFQEAVVSIGSNDMPHRSNAVVGPANSGIETKVLPSKHCLQPAAHPCAGQTKANQAGYGP